MAASALVVLALLASACGDDGGSTGPVEGAGGGAAGTGADADAAPADQPDSVGELDGEPAGGLAVPGWWPADLALPAGLWIERVADDDATQRYELVGVVSDTTVGDLVAFQRAALEAAGFRIDSADERGVDASREGTGALGFRMNEMPGGDGSGVGYSVGFLPAPASTGAGLDVSALGSGGGSAVATFGSQRWETPGECTIGEIELAFVGRNEAGVEVQVQVGLDAGREFTNIAIVAMDDGVSAAPDSALLDGVAEVDGSTFSVTGTLMNLLDREAPSQPGSVEVACG